MNRIKVLVLDFDNCLILNPKTREGSEEVKDKAWFEVFPEYDPNVLKSLLEVAKNHTAGGKADRNDIVKMICRHFGMIDSEINIEVPRRLDFFNKAVQEGIKKIGISKEVRNALFRISQKVPIYINTATPTEYVWESLETLGLKEFFKDVYGRPETKLENMKAIIAAESVSPDEVLFVDDQESGRMIAEETGCRFVGINTARNQVWHSNDFRFPIIYSLDEILSII